MRTYTIPLTGCAMTASGEMLAVTAAAGKPFKVVRFKIRAVNSSPPTAQEFQFAFNVIPTPSAGSGGTSVTPQKTLQGDAAASMTAYRNNTSATTGTIGSTPYQDGCYSNQGIDTPAPEDLVVPGGAVGQLMLGQNPASSTSVSFDGHLEVTEEF